ncbi:MAG: molybdenum cofactor biosynthesis protein MoaE [Akkermansiaceae bacterium]|jgi:molybdopterin synthase catalytic subunit|nr:molybdenum cofactor biosynthesis protein MoaE [Akkermansiaceae bacterium]
MNIDFSLTDRSIDPDSLCAPLRDPAAGAVVTFDGRVRNHNDGHRVCGLEYQAYPALALAVGRKILEDEVERHGALGAVAVHRTGPLAVGDSAVWVGVASGHRAAAFAAAQAIMERLKYELPVWKKETYGDGSVEWVGPDNTSAATGTPREDLPEWKAVLEEIWISPGNDFRGRHGGPRGDHGIIAVREIECVAGMGLKGDRYFGHKADFKGQVTFFDAEVVEAVRREFGKPGLTGEEFRRNLIVRGVRLEDWIGKRFRFQGVTFEGSEECKPCCWMDEAVAPGTEEFLTSACRGGLRARILTGGTLRVS